VSDNLSINEPTAEQLAAANAALAAANAALLAGTQPTAPVVEAPVVEAPVVEAPVVEAPVVEAVTSVQPVTPSIDEKVDFWANSWFSRNKQ
jgi:hypothetical protein